ncbi:MAG: hypothetical protein JOZ44_03385 [Acidobacteria bacterium]|nr:hypothetical protein [Acidobacteriota bacterium]
MAYGPNPYYSRSILIRFVLGIVFIAMLVWWTFAPSSGQLEFRRTQEALKHVSSWREEVPPGSNYQEEMEVSCDTQSAHLVRQARPANANGVSILDEDTRVGTTAYSRHSIRFEQDPAKDADSDWQRGSYTLSGNPCYALAHGSAVYSIPDFERLIRKAVITKQSKDYVHGRVCRSWKTQVVAPYTGRYPEQYEICIGVDDHLPYRFRRDDGLTFLYYDWNVPVSIEEPTVVEHPRTIPWQQSWPYYSNNSSYSAQQPDQGPTMRYISPTPPPLPSGPEPLEPPGGSEDDPH